MNYWVGPTEIQFSYAVQLSNIVKSRHSKCWDLLKNSDFKETPLWHTFLIILLDFFRVILSKSSLQLNFHLLEKETWAYTIVRTLGQKLSDIMTLSILTVGSKVIIGMSVFEKALSAEAQDFLQ